MTRLEKRLLSHRRKREGKHDMKTCLYGLYRIITTAFLITACITCTALPGTYSYYTHQAQTGPVTISAGIWHMDLEATVSLDPETLNPKSGGKWVIAYISLPGGCDPAAIDIPSVALSHGDKHVLSDRGEPRDHNDASVLMVKFPREQVAAMLTGCEGNVDLTVTGSGPGFSFTGTVTIRVINPPAATFTPAPDPQETDLDLGDPDPDETPVHDPDDTLDPGGDQNKPPDPVDATIPPEDDDGNTGEPDNTTGTDAADPAPQPED
jgi:hypothetical protein